MYKTYDKCLTCGGSGVYTTTRIDLGGNSIEVVQDPCLTCGGIGGIESGLVDGKKEIEDLMDRANDILNKVNDIKEKVDTL